MAALAAAALLAFASALLATGVSSSRRALSGCLETLAVRIREFGPIAAHIERERSRDAASACISQLPVLLDVLTLGLSAGLSFDASLELYCMRYGNELSSALSEAMAAWRMGLATRSAALSQLADDLGSAAFRRFASSVSEAIAFGSPLAEVLEHQAQAIRDEHRSHVEEAIEKVPVKMLIPLGTLIVPAMLLAILGPLMGPALQNI